MFLALRDLTHSKVKKQNDEKLYHHFHCHFYFLLYPQKKTSETPIPTTVETDKEDWVYLFDGSSLEGWRGYNGTKLPPGWIIKDSTLTFDTELGLEQDYTGGEDIIFGGQEFANFELYFLFTVNSNWKGK